jgi:hypothetical protein
MKIVVNRCYGGFSLSRKAVLLARKITGNPKWGGAILKGDIYNSGKICDGDYGFVEVERSDKILVEVVEKLGEKANGRCADLEIVEIPDGVNFEIEQYDGKEWVSERHRRW